MSNVRSSGMMDTIRSTRNTRTRRPTRASSLSSMGIRLTTTMVVSKMFQPDLKKSRLRGSPRKRMVISTRKKMVMNQSVMTIALEISGGIS